MARVVLNIFKTEQGEYRAVIQTGENPEPASMGEIIYQDGEEIDTIGIQGARDRNEIIRQMKGKAIKWARDNNIPFVDNIDINPYD